MLGFHRNHRNLIHHHSYNMQLDSKMRGLEINHSMACAVSKKKMSLTNPQRTHASDVTLHAVAFNVLQFLSSRATSFLLHDFFSVSSLTAECAKELVRREQRKYSFTVYFPGNNNSDKDTLVFLRACNPSLYFLRVEK